MDSIQSLPKAELHHHLEGALRPSSIAEICREHGVPLPSYDPGEVAKLVQLDRPAASLADFFIPFRTIKFCFVSREAIARLAYEVAEDAASDNIRYLETRFSLEYMSFYHNLPLEETLAGIAEGVELANRRLPIRVQMIVSKSRDLNSDTMGRPWPSEEEIVELAIRYQDRGVVGLDLSGLENGYPPELFVPMFRRARDAGLGITVHAGEAAGAESVRGAIETLGATRIGHGVRTVEDPELVKRVADLGVVLEICPTSNVYTGAVPSLEQHPVRKLSDAGVKLTISTDDPSVCKTTLSKEYQLLTDRFGFTPDELQHLNTNAWDAAFTHDSELSTQD